MAQVGKRLDLPSNLQAWERDVSRQKGDVSDIHTLEIVSSASKFYMGQFLSLRVLWRSFKATDLLPEKLGIESEHDNASKFLDGLNSWTTYLEDIRDKKTIKDTEFPDLGTFTLVRDHQLEVGQISEKQTDTSAAGFTPIANRTRSKTKVLDFQTSPLLGKGNLPGDLSAIVDDLHLDDLS